MPKRINIKQFASDEVQGEGSFITLSALTIAEAKAMQSLGNAEQVITGLEIIGRHVVDYNWVDDNGDPLPKPQDDPAFLDRLNMAELRFLVRNLVGQTGAKN